MVNENSIEQVTIGFIFASDWLRRWCRELFRLIIERSIEKPMQLHQRDVCIARYQFLHVQFFVFIRFSLDDKSWEVVQPAQDREVRLNHSEQ